MKRLLILTAVMLTAGLVSADLAATVIDGTNTVGLVKLTVPSSATHTVISVPFEKCLTTSAESGMLKDLVATVGLTASSDAGTADQLIVLTTEGATKVYYYYWLTNGPAWTPVTTTVQMPDGTEVAKNPPAADVFPLSRGLGFWFKRYLTPASDVFLKGQVTTSNQATVITNGLNLIGYGYTEALTLNTNTVSWAGANGGTDGNTTTSDKIMVVNSDGTFKEYFFFTNALAWSQAKFVNANNKWINNDYSVVTNVTIPAGQGFWYLRRGTAGFTFRPKDN